MTSAMTANLSESPSSSRENLSRSFVRYSFAERSIRINIARTTAIAWYQAMTILHKKYVKMPASSLVTPIRC